MYRVYENSESTNHDAMLVVFIHFDIGTKLRHTWQQFQEKPESNNCSLDSMDLHSCVDGRFGRKFCVQLGSLDIQMPRGYCSTENWAQQNCQSAALPD